MLTAAAPVIDQSAPYPNPRNPGSASAYRSASGPPQATAPGSLFPAS